MSKSLNHSKWLIYSGNKHAYE